MTDAVLTPRAAPRRFRVGEWLVDADQNLLSRDGEQRSVRHQAMALLLLLAEQPGQLVSREEIEQRIWDGNAFVAPKGMTNALWALRQALGDDPEQPRYVQTVAKKGYRLVAEVVDEAATEGLPRQEGVQAQQRPGGGAPPVGELPPAPGAPTRSLWRPHGLWAACVALVMLALLLAWPWLNQREAAEEAPPRAASSSAPVTAAPLQNLQVLRSLTQLPGHEYLGAISPDGQWLAYAHWQWRGAAELFLRPAAALQEPAQSVSMDGRELLSLAWSPDGRRLAIASAMGNRDCRVDLLAFATRERRELAECTIDEIGAGLAWSPNGRELAYLGRHQGRRAVLAKDPDSPSMARVLFEPGAGESPRFLVWHDGGQHLSYTLLAQGATHVEQLRLADGQRRRLNAQPLADLQGLAQGPDGDWLVAQRAQEGAQLARLHAADGSVHPLGVPGRRPVAAGAGRWLVVHGVSHSSLAAVSMDGRSTPLKPVLSLAQSLSSPDWHAARQRLVAVTLRGNVPGLVLQEGDAPPRELLNLPGLAADPQWSPDGRRIAYRGQCKPGTERGLCVFSLDEGSVLELSGRSLGYGPPVWSGDGRAVWAASARGGDWQVWRFALDGQASALTSEGILPRARLAIVGEQVVVPSRDGEQLLALDAVSGATRQRWPTNPVAGEHLLDYRPWRDGLLLLQRGAHERFETLDLRTGARQELARYPAGSFDESARFTSDEAQRRVIATKLDVANSDLVLVGF
ncbi:MAG: PD40 domain-containing protein [Burkholderiales bacterium]|nr:PD40 domain-containing protein [Burkholderiales bacterium]